VARTVREGPVWGWALHAVAVGRAPAGDHDQREADTSPRAAGVGWHAAQLLKIGEGGAADRWVLKAQCGVVVV
jgi:hypothetical protein